MEGRNLYSRNHKAEKLKRPNYNKIKVSEFYKNSKKLKRLFFGPLKIESKGTFSRTQIAQLLSKF